MISENIFVTGTNDDETDREEYILGGNAYDGNSAKNCKKTPGLRVKAVSEINRSSNITDEVVSVSAVKPNQISTTSNSLKQNVLVWTVKKVPVMLNESTIVEDSEASICNSSKRIKLTDAIHLNNFDEVVTKRSAPKVVNIITTQSKEEPGQISSVVSTDKDDDMESNLVTVSREKYRNSTQVEIFLEFMEAHPDLANNSIHMDRVAADVLWTELTRKLNINGPPRRDVIQWKKVWFDWKCIVRRKLSQNMNEIEITHGKQIHKYMLNHKEKAIARICHLLHSVKDVSGPHEVENKRDEVDLIKSDVTRTESISSKEIPKLNTAHFEFPTKMINCRNPLQSVQKHLTSELRAVQSVASSMEHILQNSKENTKIRAKSNNNFQKVYESLEKLTDLISKKNTLICKQNDERRNQYFEIEKIAAEKTKLRWKKLQLERLKSKRKNS